MGGWSLSPYHGYDLGAHTLYRGDGRRVSGQGPSSGGQLAAAIRTAAGGKPCCNLGDGGPALQAYLTQPRGLALDAEGNLYFADEQALRVRRIDKDGIITTVAGRGGYSGPLGDGGPATAARLRAPCDVALYEQGSKRGLYIAESGDQRVRHVDLTTGIITTVAGTGVAGFSGDWGPAPAARLYGPSSVAVGADGSLYIAELSNRRVRRVAVSPSGVANGAIMTVAGGGDEGLWLSGPTPKPSAPATKVYLAYPVSIAVGGPDGSLYIADQGTGGSGVRIYRVTPNGVMSIFAGWGPAGYAPDGTSATVLEAKLNMPDALEVTLDGVLYFVATLDPQGTYAVRRIAGGVINTVVGRRNPNCYQGVYCGEGGPPREAQLAVPSGLAVRLGQEIDTPFESEDLLYIADRGSPSRILRIDAPLPGVKIGELAVPSEDGAELYVFSEQARHLRTLDALSGKPRYQFEHDGDGRLQQITDVDGRKTSIVYGPGGVQKIVGPFGHEALLGLHGDGYLASVTDPSGASEKFGYNAPDQGLMTSRTDARGNIYSYSYDPKGRLTHAADPPGASGAKSLERTDTEPSGNVFHQYAVKLTTALCRTSNYEVTTKTDRTRLLANTFPDGLKATSTVQASGNRATTLPDGTEVSPSYSPDPRFSTAAPLPSLAVKTGGKSLTVTTQRAAELLVPENPLSIKSLTDAVAINGRSFTTTYLPAATNNLPYDQVVRTTPAGRKSITEIDAKGRPIKVTVPSALGLVPTEFFYYDPQLDPSQPGGKLRAIRQVAGVEERLYQLVYDPQGNLASIEAPLGKSVGFQYDPVGRVTAKVMPDGSKVRFAYDASRNVTAIAVPGTPEPAQAAELHRPAVRLGRAAFARARAGRVGGLRVRLGGQAARARPSWPPSCSCRGGA
ncbi:MAG: hypothetical protein HY744_06595 [Deltaproteobacteria bacterium]|nr:hypothetical protein [Deltaproteobacteria bacterium]